jgi:hypothetical protein
MAKSLQAMEDTSAAMPSAKRGLMRLDEERDWTTLSIFSIAAEWAS